VATVNYLLRLQKRVMFVTNNSNKTRAQFVQQTLDPDEPRFYL
jgi:ribonucleotide monophosphatase NagD (HAD superfamily)